MANKLKKTKEQVDAKIAKLDKRLREYEQYEDIGGPEYGPKVVVTGYIQSRTGKWLERRLINMVLRYPQYYPNPFY